MENSEIENNIVDKRFENLGIPVLRVNHEEQKNFQKGGKAKNDNNDFIINLSKLYRKFTAIYNIFIISYIKISIY